MIVPLTTAGAEVVVGLGVVGGGGTGVVVPVAVTVVAVTSGGIDVPFDAEVAEVAEGAAVVATADAVVFPPWGAVVNRGESVGGASDGVRPLVGCGDVTTTAVALPLDGSG